MTTNPPSPPKDSAFRLLALNRHRLGTDGAGVTTLVLAAGCPLRCRYCLNPRCWDAPGAPYTARALYEAVRVDNLYFLATGGGVTFGGGEPLLYADCIAAFAALCDADWNLLAETSLQAPESALRTVAEAGLRLLVDVKDTDADIYRRYTGADNALALHNLRRLAEWGLAERVTLRLPLIPGYNTEADRLKSLEMLKAMGYARFDLFTYARRDAYNGKERDE